MISWLEVEARKSKRMACGSNNRVSFMAMRSQGRSAFGREEERQMSLWPFRKKEVSPKKEIPPNPSAGGDSSARDAGLPPEGDPKTRSKTTKRDHASSLERRIIDRGWTCGHVVALCEFCKKSREMGAGDHHTIWWLGNVLDGYFRGVDGLKTNNYRFISSSQIRLEDIKLWSVAALAAREANPKAKVIREHGTPMSAFTKIGYDRYLRDGLTKDVLDDLIAKYYRLAVITDEEDRRLKKLARSRMYDTAEARWAAAGIVFPAPVKIAAE